MATGSCPPWMDEALFNLQDPAIQGKLSTWEKDFIESVSKQYANWQASTSRMSFGTTKQHVALIFCHKRQFPHLDLYTFKPFDT